MTLDDFFGDTEAAWKRKLEREEAARKAAEAEERRKRIEELKARKGRKGSNPLPDPVPAAGASPNGTSPIVTSLADYIKLENITCVDAEGHEFERYGELYVAKDIVRKPDTKQENKKPSFWAVYFEEKGLFLPSFALTCNIVVALYSQRANAEVEKVLQQYKNHGEGNGYQAQNTIIAFGTEKVIHYPADSEYGLTGNLNKGRTRRELSFSKATLQDNLLEEALRGPDAVRYTRQLTGLRDPSMLVEIGNYFGKSAKLWFPWNGQNGSAFTDTRAAWFGCGLDCFDLSSYGDLGSTNAARGVRERAP